MKQLVCEMCGSTDLIKEGGVFVCQSCGCKYSVEEAKKMMVEGVVSVDKSDDARRFLDLARQARKASNNSKAEDYASQVLEIDTNNYEAWFIQGSAIGWQASIANDRYQEAFSCFNKMLEIITGLPIDKVTPEMFELIKQLKSHIVEITSARCELYSNPFKTQPSVANKNYITQTLKSIIILYAVLLDTIEKALGKLIDKIDGANDDAKILLDKEELKRLKSSIRSSIGEIYYDAAIKLNACQVESFSNWNERWEKIRIFDYYGTGNYNLDAESTAFNNCSVAYENMQDVLTAAIAFMQMDDVERYVTSTNDSISLLRSISGKDLSNIPTADEQLKLFFENKIFIGETDIKMRTNRRYHNQYSSGRVTSDGYTYNATAKAERQRNIDYWKRLRDEHDPVKKAAKARQEAEDAKSKKKAHATTLLTRRYFKVNPDEKAAYDAAYAAIDSAVEERKQCTERIKNLGVFKRKERKQLEARIAELKTTEERYRAEIAAIEGRRDKWIGTQMPSLLKMDESKWPKE